MLEYWEQQRKRESIATIAKLTVLSGVSERHMPLADFGLLNGTDEYRLCASKLVAMLGNGDATIAIIGKRGTGKTQIACAAVMHFVRSMQSARITTVIRLIADLKRRYGSEEHDADGSWLKEWGGLHFLAIDEIAEKLESEHSRVMLTALVDERYQNRRLTLLVGNVSVEKFSECVGGSIADRCNDGGGVLSFDKWTSFRGKSNA